MPYARPRPCYGSISSNSHKTVRFTKEAAEERAGTKRKIREVQTEKKKLCASRSITCSSKLYSSSSSPSPASSHTFCLSQHDSSTVSENTILTVNDVLCGRGSPYFDHIGNRRFRVLVEMNLSAYEAAGPSREKKGKIICSVIDCVMNCNPPGRFLKKDPKTNSWVLLSYPSVREKTGQAFREAMKDKDWKTDIENKGNVANDSLCVDEETKQAEPERSILSLPDSEMESSTNRMDSECSIISEELLSIQQKAFLRLLYSSLRDENDTNLESDCEHGMHEKEDSRSNSSDDTLDLTSVPSIASGLYKMNPYKSVKSVHGQNKEEGTEEKYVNVAHGCGCNDPILFSTSPYHDDRVELFSTQFESICKGNEDMRKVVQTLQAENSDRSCQTQTLSMKTPTLQPIIHEKGQESIRKMHECDEQDIAQLQAHARALLMNKKDDMQES